MNRERDERMWELAYKLARSGEYINCWLIEKELQYQGFRRAQQLLSDPDRRDELDRMCAVAQKGRTNA